MINLQFSMNSQANNFQVKKRYDLEERATEQLLEAGGSIDANYCNYFFFQRFES